MSRLTPFGEEPAGTWLSRFLTDHLAAERDLSPQSIASYRDAIRLLLTWFRDQAATPPEKLRLVDLDRARVLAFLDWLEIGRGNSPATRNQRLAVINPWSATSRSSGRSISTKPPRSWPSSRRRPRQSTWAT